MNGPPAPRSLEEILAQGYTVRTGDYLRKGWEVFSGYPVGFLGFAFLLTLASNAVPFLVPIAGQLVGLTIQLIMMAGLALVAWEQMRSRPVAFSDFFPAWHTVGQLFLCTVVGLFLIAVGLILLVIPGIYLMIAYTFSYMLIVDRHLDPWQALEGSRRVVNKHWWGIFGLTMVLLLVVGSGIVIGGVLLGLPFGYALSGFFPTVSLDELPIELPSMGGALNLGVLVGIISGTMVGGGVGVAVGGCMLGAAYADIFGLASDRTGPSEQDAHTFPSPSSS
jgi:hypothetical protein